jgi:hypothetical protein
MVQTIFVKGNYRLPTSDSLILLNLAKQCYITDGPAVFRARSMYTTVTGKPDNSFAEKCLTETGNFKKEKEADKQILIKVYPTVLSRASALNVESPENGTIKLINTLGQITNSFALEKGKNSFSLEDIPYGYYIYTVKLKSSNTGNGKLIFK